MKNFQIFLAISERKKKEDPKHNNGKNKNSILTEPEIKASTNNKDEGGVCKGC
jgi:hypothetical protein